MPTIVFIRRARTTHRGRVFFIVIIIFLFHGLYSTVFDPPPSTTTMIIIIIIQFIIIVKVSNVRRTHPRAEGIDAAARGTHTSSHDGRR